MIAAINTNITFEQGLTPYQLRLWKNLSPAPRRKVPDFSEQGRAAELEIIQNTLKAKKDGYGNVDLKTSGDQCAPGMFLGSGDELGDFRDTIPKEERIEDIFTLARMGEFFNAARDGAAVPHDRKQGGKISGWRPGLFVIDEIFKALCSELHDMIDAANNGLAGAQDTLNAFVNRISSIADGDPEAAMKYRRFIDYATQDNGELSDDQKTYIKLVRTSSPNGFITGAIIHINDWRDGTHSSGKAHS